MDEEMDRVWRTLSEEILTDLKAWRVAHPKATFREIEQAVRARTTRLEAQLLQDTAQASASREWSGKEEQDRPACPGCSSALHSRGKQSRTLQASGGQSVKLQRGYGTCPTCGVGLFPLDEELALLPGSLTPIQQDHLVHRGAVMPFAQAAKMLETLLGVQVSEATVRRMTEPAGTGYEQVQLLQSQHVQAQEQPASPAWFYAQEKPVPVAGKAVLSSDGAYVPLSTGEWAEVRTLAIGQVQSHTTAQGEEQFKVSHLSYFSRMSTAEAFETLCEGELHRRGIRHVAQVCAVTDGAIWLQHFIDLHRPDALRILDFPHAAEYVNAIGEGVRQAGRHLPKQWREGVLHRLKHQGPEHVLHHLSRLCEWCHDPEVEKKRRYLCTRQNLMHSPTYRAAGWPIGSGMVESANKLVMQTRLKGPGMRWEPTHVNPMLALRTAVCNDQWSEAWSLIQQQRQHQQEQKRQQQAIPRLTELVASTLLLLLRFRPPLPRPVPAEPAPKASPRPAEPAATLPGSWRPSAHHIWKCTPACRPKLVAKK